MQFCLVDCSEAWESCDLFLEQYNNNKIVILILSRSVQGSLNTLKVFISKWHLI